MLVKSSKLSELLPPGAFNFSDLRSPRARRPRRDHGLLKITKTHIKIPCELFPEYGERFTVSAVLYNNCIWLVPTSDGLLVTRMSPLAYRIYRKPSHPNIFKIGVYTPFRDDIVEGIKAVRIPGAVAAGAREIDNMARWRQRTSAGNH